MSQRADIDNVFRKAIRDQVGDEYHLLLLKLEVYESLEWDSAADETAEQMKMKGYQLPQWYAGQ
jgi:hypothetical protein